jgi:hypothetical protein
MEIYLLFSRLRWHPDRGRFYPEGFFEIAFDGLQFPWVQPYEA